MKEVFRAKTGPGAYIPIIIGFIIVFSPLLIFVFATDEGADLSFGWVVIFPLLIMILFLYVLIGATLRMFISYTITSEGVYLRKPPFHTRFFEFSKIDSARYLTPEETRRQVETSVKEHDSYGESADLAGYIRTLREKSPEYKYYTIAPRVKVKSVGAKERITSLKASKTGGSVLLELKDGRKFYLTPAQPERFKHSFDTISNYRVRKRT